MNNSFIGGAPAKNEPPPAAPEVVEAAAPPAEVPAAVEAPAPVEAAPATDAPIVVETKTYADGSSATGVAPLPDESPNGAPVVDAPVEVVDYKALYDAEVIAHAVTKAKLVDAEAICASAKAMGFRGAGIHTGA